MIKTILLVLMKAILQFVYFFFKLFPARNKIVFITKLEDFPTLDFKLLTSYLSENHPEIEVVVLCRRFRNKFSALVKFFFHMLRQMYHIATCRLLVLDGYNIIACMLKQKKSLKILQLWHALGLFKRFGHSAVGTDEGSDPNVAKIMKMHHGYNCAICSSEFIKDEIAAAYNISPDKVLPVGLPRIDYLTKEEYITKSREKIFNAYPHLNNSRETILYVPTFRKYNSPIPYEELSKKIDYSKYNLIVKLHNGKEVIYTDGKTISELNTFKGIDFMSVSDYVISDYSAIIFEALAAKKPLFLYCYDYDKYLNKRGFFLDYNTVPAVISKKVDDIVYAIENKTFTDIDSTDFMQKYVSNTDYNMTKSIANIIINMYNGKDIDKDNLLLK